MELNENKVISYKKPKRKNQQVVEIQSGIKNKVGKVHKTKKDCVLELWLKRSIIKRGDYSLL